MKKGSHMGQDDYLKLEAAAEGDVGHCSYSTILSDAEAKILINDEFGFEVSRIEIIDKAEIDITQEGAQYIKIEWIPRKALYESTDWNYVRFNVHSRGATWYYEMVNGELYQVLI